VARQQVTVGLLPHRADAGGRRRRRSGGVVTSAALDGALAAGAPNRRHRSWYRELQALTDTSLRSANGLLHPVAGQSPWFDDRRTPEHEDLPALARRAMLNVLARGDPRPWGDVHSLTAAHPLGAIPVLGWLAGFNVGPVRLGGGNQTVSVCPSREYAPPFSCSEGPSMRHVVDFGDVDGAGGFILPTGQSGNPRSPHYRDQVGRWLRGELWIVPVDVRRVRATATLVLAP
jgi:acyl-homoserine lactone acylase PvdQ